MPNKNQQSTLGELTKYKFDPKRPVPVPTPILSLKGVPLCTPGNISNIQGPAKSAKSAVMGAALAAMLRAITGKPMDENETLNFGSALPKNDEATRQIILHFDTEQSFYHHHRLCMDVLRRAGIQQDEYATLPFRSYALLPMGYHERKRMMEEALRHALDEQFRIACIFIDGVADIISDPNNADESFAIVDWLHSLAADPESIFATSSGRSTKPSRRKSECAIVTILHENPGDKGKPRGHLGSQIERKSETNLRVRKGPCIGKRSADTTHDSVSVIWVERARGAHIPEKDGVKIRWNQTQQRHTLHAPGQHAQKAEPAAEPPKPPQSSPLTNAQERTRKWLERALKQPKKRKQLLESIMNQLECSAGTARNRIDEWVKLGWIHKMPGAGSAPYALGPLPVEQSDEDASREPKPGKGLSGKKSGKSSKKPPTKSAEKAAKKTANHKPTAKQGTKVAVPKELPEKPERTA